MVELAKKKDKKNKKNFFGGINKSIINKPQPLVSISPMF